MHGTRPLNDTRPRQTNNGHIHCNYHIEQHSIEIDNSEMKNNVINAHFFRSDGQLRYHWGADDDIMAIANKNISHPKLRS